MRRGFLMMTAGLLAMSSCSLTDPSGEIPSYIHIESFNLTTDANQGSNSHRITDAWVGINDNLIGAYYMPSTIPVIGTGSNSIKIFAGIIENGISATREIYPFFEEYVIEVDLNQTEIDTLFPETTYSSATQFVFIEDFEFGNIFGDDLDGNPATNMNTITTGVFEGQRSGRITLLDDFAVAVVGTTTQYPLPKVSIPVFLELNYRCDIDFSVGLRGITGNESESVTKLTLTAREDWNKVYISLDEEVNFLNTALYQIFFSAEKPNSLPEANIYLDNIKLLHL